MRIGASLLFLSLAIIQNLCAYGESEYTIPGASCAFGQPYKIFVRRGDSDKLLLNLPGGGACWNESSCDPDWFHYATTEISSEYMQRYQGLFRSNNLYSPFKNDSVITFPYCTGDLFAGTHTATYDDEKVRHLGRKNLQLAIKYILEKKIVVKKDIKRLSVYGDSGGGIGVLLNMDLLESLGNSAIRKTAIIDSPGLHWKNSVWDRFSNRYVKDLKDAGQRVNFEISEDLGLQAARLGSLCRNYKSWNFAFLQGSRDTVMSYVFGRMTAEDHEDLVYSKYGILQTLKSSFDNCAVWVASSRTHVFLNKNDTYQTKNSSGKSARDFTIEVLSRKKLERMPSSY